MRKFDFCAKIKARKVISRFEETLTKFFEQYRLVTYKKGENILRPGDTFTNVYFVKKGYVRLYNTTLDGKEITINLFKPLFYLSLMYSLNKKECRYFFEAITDTEIWKAPLEDFLAFIEKDREASLLAFEATTNAINSLLMHIESSSAGRSYNKIASILVSLIRDFGSTDEEGVTKVDFSTTHRVIASLAGISRETASIQIKRLEKDGIITQSRESIIVKDIEKLKEASSLE